MTHTQGPRTRRPNMARLATEFAEEVEYRRPGLEVVTTANVWRRDAAVVLGTGTYDPAAADRFRALARAEGYDPEDDVVEAGGGWGFAVRYPTGGRPPVGDEGQDLLDGGLGYEIESEDRLGELLPAAGFPSGDPDADGDDGWEMANNVAGGLTDEVMGTRPGSTGLVLRAVRGAAERGELAAGRAVAGAPLPGLLGAHLLVGGAFDRAARGRFRRVRSKVYEFGYATATVTAVVAPGVDGPSPGWGFEVATHGDADGTALVKAAARQAGFALA